MRILRAPWRVIRQLVTLGAYVDAVRSSKQGEVHADDGLEKKLKILLVINAVQYSGSEP